MMSLHGSRSLLSVLRKESCVRLFGCSASSSFVHDASLVDPQIEARVGPVPPRPLPEDIWQTSSLQQRTISFPPTLRQHAEVVDHEEVRREREPAVPAEPSLERTSDRFLTLPDVKDATDGPVFLYRENRLKGLFRKDARQESTVLELQHLFNECKGVWGKKSARRSGLTVVDHLNDSSDASLGENSWWHWIKALPGTGNGAPSAHAHINGLYMFGGVGTGKTMLMDLFVQACPPDFQVRRIHFHNFMLDVHAHLKAFAHEADPLVHVAEYIAGNWHVLALDEFFVTDIADASILNRLFTRLWTLGVVLVATSNRAPDALYEGGLQRVLFLPFIDRLKENCVVHDMNSETDYRRLAHFHRGLYFTKPDFDDPDEELITRFEEVVRDGHKPERPERVEIMMGRHINIARAGATVCLIDFEDVCGRPTAAADFIALAERFDTMALKGVPIFSGSNKEKAYRFVTLVDVLYEHRCRLFCSAAGSPFDLFRNIISVAEAKSARQTKASLDMAEVDDNLAFAKERCISRLTEMQSLEYLIAHAEQHGHADALSVLKELQQKQASTVSRKL